ncbi:MAG: hypothetical protein RBR19_07735 [Sedimentisphaerales bacterium]|jgi:hypothetical protein|nr:hypothetical protein [Planctomycetota bacterium]MDY0355754.1 hypothetical protein [Sedimentisphaerales bacterium]
MPQDTKTSLYRRWTQHWWSPLGLFLLLFLPLLFHMVGRHMVRGVLQWVYTPPALTEEKAAVYTEFIRVVERHPEYTRVFLNTTGRLSAEPVVAEDRGFTESEVTALHRLARRFRDVGCIFAERGESYIAFMPYPRYILPASPGVVYSLDARHPDEMDDWILNRYKPFVHITGRWYASKSLILSPFRRIDSSPLGESLIDRSLRCPSTLAE